MPHLETQLSVPNGSRAEHAYRPALQKLLPELDVNNEPKRIECDDLI
jgi:hypothetical protein